MRPWIPVIDPLLGNVAKLGVYHDRLQHARDRADREDFFGPDPQHVAPDTGMLFRGDRGEPFLVELLQSDGGG